MKSPRSLFFLLLLAVLPCVLFSTLTEFARDIKEIDFQFSTALGGETSESGGNLLLISESLLFYSQQLTQNRVQLNKFWRQFLALVMCVPFLKNFSKISLRKYYLHHYFPLKFFHGLVLSLLLGGRAPPRPAY
jgi:hypothetical protein